MNSSDIFAQEYKMGSRSYLLSNRELRCIDASHAKNNFLIPLNQIDPYYYYGCAFSPLFLLCTAYLMMGVLVRGSQWFYGSAQFDIFGNEQLIVFSIFLAFAGYQYYRYQQNKSTFQFSFLRNNEVAFSLPLDKKNKERTQKFVDAIVDRINQQIPSNEHILFLFSQYGLLTHAECAQLDAYIQEHKSERKSEPKPKENIIQLSN